MQPFTLHGVNGSVTLDANGVTIANRRLLGARRRDDQEGHLLRASQVLRPLERAARLRQVGLLDLERARRRLKLGERVLGPMNDGQKYVANLAAIEPQQMLVVFPNGSQQWVGRELVQRA